MESRRSLCVCCFMSMTGRLDPPCSVDGAGTQPSFFYPSGLAPALGLSNLRPDPRRAGFGDERFQYPFRSSLCYLGDAPLAPSNRYPPIEIASGTRRVTDVVGPQYKRRLWAQQSLSSCHYLLSPSEKVAPLNWSLSSTPVRIMGPHIESTIVCPSLATSRGMPGR
ncbi:hypothetical protein FB45DRAFT_38683 [Roridomyces roridus]|uniref:Uncharacterized protein n=1 Tax=Roridomyces roridus TaxID=1738132 RepID=A0AAD7FN12_9AGAR|nr:hypothetical protein FB45DRAFT_38683 [Roridomyces roridus]